MKIIFMGTSDFAVPILERLTQSEHTLLAVYTKPPSLGGRGMKEIKSPIHCFAESHNLPVITPTTFKIAENIEYFKALQADIAVVASYGLILRSEILNSPKFGCINVHPSKLPRWRGAAPIQHTIMSGDNETAVCIMQMGTGLDTGDIILSKNVIIDNIIDHHNLSIQLARTSSNLVVEALSLIEHGKAKRIKQTSSGVTYAEKITKSDQVIDWNQPATMINCKIRALSTKPGAYFIHNQHEIKILKAEVLENLSLDYSSNIPGQVIDDQMLIYCGNNTALRPLILHKASGKVLNLSTFLLGNNFSKGMFIKP